jgi:hypothetical protein
MTPREVKRALRLARLDFHAARVNYLRAVREAERLLYRKDQPSLLRKQI